MLLNISSVETLVLVYMSTFEDSHRNQNLTELNIATFISGCRLNVLRSVNIFSRRFSPWKGMVMMQSGPKFLNTDGKTREKQKPGNSRCQQIDANVTSRVLW